MLDSSSSTSRYWFSGAKLYIKFNFSKFQIKKSAFFINLPSIYYLRLHFSYIFFDPIKMKVLLGPDSLYQEFANFSKKMKNGFMKMVLLDSSTDGLLVRVIR